MVSQIWNFRIYWRSYILAILLGKLIKSFFLLSGCRKYTQKTLRNLSFRIWIISWRCRWRVLLVMSQVGLSLSLCLCVRARAHMCGCVRVCLVEVAKFCLIDYCLPFLWGPTVVQQVTGWTAVYVVSGLILAVIGGRDSEHLRYYLTIISG